MDIHRIWRRPVPIRQQVFEFQKRAQRNERRFKLGIVLATSLVIGLILKYMPWGRYLAALVTARAHQAVGHVVGISTSQSEADLAQRARQMGIEATRARAERFYLDAEPDCRRMLRYAGLDPEQMLLCPGNYDWTLVLSSKVFDADDSGRSYRFKPQTHSIWLMYYPRYGGGPMPLLVPDGPGLRDAVRGIVVVTVETSRQTTNSWGLRGPEPDLGAPLRGIVVGDSYMQGAFIGDAETAPECLRRYLGDHLKTGVSILNTGVMGYSPEQYYHTLVAFADRFRPHFVVVSVFANDFGDMVNLGTKGQGDWESGKYWLEKSVNYCKTRRWPCLIVPAPYITHILEKRNSGYYPGILSNILEIDSLMYLYPIEDFANAQLAAVNKAKREGQTLRTCPLFNTAIGDNHFSAAGAAVWAEAVGRRLVLILEGNGGDAPRS
jgi:hypothetical protein